MENEHNKKGLELLRKIKEELGGDYPIVFSPSKSRELYQGVKK